MVADLGAADPAEEALGLVDAGALQAVGALVADALGGEAGMQRVPVGGLVGMDGGGAAHAGLDEGR